MVCGMTRQPIPGTNQQSIESVERIQRMIADLSTELSKLNYQLKSRTDDAEQDRPVLAVSDAEMARRPRESTVDKPERVPVSPTERARGERTCGERARGEPVDTSFAEPDQSPVASAAGHGSDSAEADAEAPNNGTESASHQPEQHETGRSTRGMLAWVGGTAGLLGVVLIAVISLRQDWYAPLGQLLAGALLGAALFSGALLLHHKSTGRTV